MSRRCLICANINPCRNHSDAEQQGELARNDAAIARIRSQDIMGSRSIEPPAEIRSMGNAYDKRETRIRCVREALVRVARHVVPETDVLISHQLLEIARCADDETLNAIGQMLKHIA